MWQLFEQNPSRQQQVTSLIGLLIDAQQDAEAVALARKLEQFERRRGERRSFLGMMQEVAGAHRASPEVLEFMSELFNSSNREADYCQTLLKLFDLHYGMGNYPKAAECLDRAAEVDAYEPGHQKRLESLQGKIDENRYRVIASRFSSLSTSGSEPVKSQEPSLGSAALQDLMLQAEILVQYGMRTKAIERLQRIQELFPREEERNQELQRLYLAAGMTPRYAGSGTAPPTTPSSAGSAQEAPASRPTSHSEANVSGLTRVAEISRKLYRQSNSDNVLATAVSEIGSHWKVNRCIAAMRKPGQPPTSVREHCADGGEAGKTAALEKIVSALQDVAISRGTLTIADAASAPELESAKDAVAELGLKSLLAVPLTDGPDHVGILLLAHGSAGAWRPSDMVLLKAIGEQIVIALNNVGLRRLVKNLSVTDEHSGLLKRASYLDLLMAETRRAAQQNTAVTVLLMQFGKSGAMLKEFGEAALEATMQQIGQVFSANIRQNDLAFRYGTTSIAIVLGETSDKEALLAVEKLRKLLSKTELPAKHDPGNFCAGLAEAVVQAQYDPVDVVTEVINRAEQAVEAAIGKGAGATIVLAPATASAAFA